MGWRSGPQPKGEEARCKYTRMESCIGPSLQEYDGFDLKLQAFQRCPAVLYCKKRCWVRLMKALSMAPEPVMKADAE